MAGWWEDYKKRKGLSSGGNESRTGKTYTERITTDEHRQAAKSSTWWEDYKKKNDLERKAASDRQRAAQSASRLKYRSERNQRFASANRQLDENRSRDAAEDEIRELFRNPFSSDAEWEAGVLQRNAERYKRDLPLYQQAMQNSSTWGEYFSAHRQAGESQSAVKHQFERYQQATQKAEQERNESNLVNRPALYASEHMTPEQISAELDRLRSGAATPTVTDKDRNDPVYAYLYPEAALKKVPHGARFDERLLEGAGQDAIDALYRPILTEQEKAAVEEADRQIIEDKANHNYERVQILKAAQSMQTERTSRETGNQLMEEIATGGAAAKQVEDGRAAFEAKQQRIASETSFEIGDDLDSNRGAYNKMQKERRERGYILGYDWDNVPEARKQAVYALYAQDPEKAMELAKYYIADARQAADEEKQAWYAQNGWTAALGLVSSAAAHLGAAVDPFGDVGQELTRRGDNALAGGSQWADAATGYQKIPEWVPIVGGKGAGDFYQTVGSVVQSAAVAAPAILVGRYDKAAAEVVGKLGLALMGSSAAASDYRESVAAGMDEDRAKLHALAAGVEEALFEEVSLDKLIKMDTSGGLKAALKNWLVQSGVEGSEELATSIANRITDEMISGAGQSKVERRASELIANGMNSTEAHTQAESEWMTDTLYEGFSGFLSGGMMTGGNYALKGIANLKGRAVNAAVNREAQKLAGAAVSRSEGSVEAIQAYAKDKGIEIKDVETAEQNAEQGEQGGNQNSYSARDYRSISETNSKVVQSIRSEVRGKTVQEQQAVRDSLVEKYGEGIAPVVNQAISVETAARVRQEYGNVDSIQAARNRAVSEIKDESLRRAVSDGYDSAAYSLAASQGGEGGMNAMSRYIQQRRNTGSGSEMSMNATVTTQDGSTKTISITGMSEDGKRVSLADGSEVAVKDLQADADTTSAIQQLADLDLGADATKVLQAYQQSGISGTEGYRWLMDYATAYNQGRTRQISLEQAAQRSSLDERTVMDAYTLGQQAANRETQAGLEKLKNLPKRKGASGRTANIDTTEIKGKTMSKSELDQFELANQYAQALGVDMTWFSSKEKDGKFIGKNGAYENGKIYMDIHAGRNFAADLTSGILATMGHELTHFQQQYAPEEYQAIKEFLFEQIVKSSPNGEARLERLIWEKQRRSGNTLSRKAAEDEVVADACQKMLRDSKAVHDFASQQPEAANGVIRWLDKWFKKVRSIFGRGGNYSEEAQIMDSLEQDVKAAFGELWDKALKQAVQVHDEVGNIEKATAEGESKAQNSERDTEYLELAKDPEKNAAQLQEMVDEAAREAGYTIKAYHGTYSQFTAFSPEKSSKNNDYGPGIYLTTDEANARGYAGTNGIWNADLSNNVDIYAQEEANEKFDQEEDYNDWVDAYNAAWDRKAKEIEENGRVLSLYARGKKLFTVSLDVQITIDEAIKILQAMPKSVQADVKEWQMEVKRIAGKNNTISTYAFANSNWSLYLSYALNNIGYSGIEDTSVNKKFSLFFGTEHYVIFNATDVKSADPVTYDDSGNVIPLSERFNAKNEDIRYSERDNAKPRSAQAQRDAGYKLSESKFYSLYSAHKLNMTGKGNVQEQISSIMADGFKGDGGFGNNVMPTNISYDVDENGKRIPRGLSAQKYAPKKGEYILLVPKEGVEVKGGRYNFTERVKPGYKPAFDYEIVQADYDGQPYYEMYEKAYDKSQAEKADVTLDGAQFSERDYFDGMSEEQVQEELAKLQQEKATAREKQRSLEKTDEYKQLFQAVLDTRSPEAISAFNKWADESGYVAAVDRAKEVDVRRSEGAKVLDRLIDQRLEREEREAIQKSGKSEAEYFASQAVKDFGYTPYFYDAGYIAPNGKMLNFSGQKGRHFGSRGQDHRAIGQIYAATKGSAAMNRFMNQGNVRIMAESPGIDISNATPLTKEQYATIRRFVNEVRSDEYFNLDFSDERGNNIGSIEYEGRFTADRVLNDIRHFFDTGEVRQPSSLSAFYSERDYSAPSDEELLMNAKVEDAESPETRAALQNSQKQARQIRDLTRRLERLQTEIRGYEGDNPNRISVQRFTRQALDLFGIPAGVRTDMGELLQSVAEGVLAGHNLSQNDIMYFFETLITNGREKTVADETLAEIRDDLRGRKIYVNENVKAEFGDDWNAFRKRAFSLGIQLTNNEKNMGIDSVNAELAELYPGKFDADETDLRSILENIVDTAESGKTSDVPILDAMREIQKQTGEPVREQLQTMLDQFTRQIEIMQDQAAVERKARAGNAAEIAKARKQINEAKEALREVRKQRDAWKRKSEGADARQKRALDAALRGVVQHDAKQIAEAVRQKQALAKKLQDQIDREKKILSGELRAPELVKLLKAEREKAEARVKEQKEAQFARYKEGKKAGELRGRISSLKKDLQKSLLHPTDTNYVPAGLAKSIVDALDALDTSPREGTQSAAKYAAISDKLRAVAVAYNDMHTSEEVGYEYTVEYDQELSKLISDLANTMEGRNARDLSADELKSVYDYLRSIRDTMVEARKLLSNLRYESVREAIASGLEQQSKITPIDDVSKMERKKRLSVMDKRSPMRAVEFMSNMDRSAALYEAFQQVEAGDEQRLAWSLAYQNDFRELKSGKNEKTYWQSLTKQSDYGATDKKTGKPVTMTKMQAIQLFMTAQREAANKDLEHFFKGGATIRNAKDIMEGKENIRSNEIFVTPELLKNIENSFTEWDREYMTRMRDYLKREGKAVNKVFYKLKHRVLALEENYVPTIVDQKYLDAKLETTDFSGLFVKSPRSTQAITKGAPQPLIIDGMETMMNKHVQEQAQYIGMATAIRDFAKIFNGKVSTSENGVGYTSLKAEIERNFGKKGVHLITQALIDIQGGSTQSGWRSGLEKVIKKLQTSFVRHALLFNLSVTIKQAASYVAAGSIISREALLKGNRSILNKNEASHSASLITQIFLNPNGKTAQKIFARADKYTALHADRRNGMNFAEIELGQKNYGKLRQKAAEIGANLEQKKGGHKVREIGAALNPASWIQRMDVATTAALFVACEYQARMDGLEGEAYHAKVKELYERVLRETQPMYDSLHRTAQQKSGGSLAQYLFPFRTVPIQNHGQMASAYDRLLAAKTKSDTEKAEAAKFFRKTLISQIESAVVFSAMTFAAALTKRKTKKYRDEDGELTLESVARGFGLDVASTLVSVASPMWGSELWSLSDRFINKFTGKGGYTYDSFSVGALDMINDTAAAIDRIAADVGKAMRREDVSQKEFGTHMFSLLTKLGNLSGIPADTIKTYTEGFIGNIQDAIDGRIPALNDESWERDAATNARRYMKAIQAGDTEKAEAVMEEMRENYKEEKPGLSEKAITRKIRNALTSYIKEQFTSKQISEDEAISYLVDYAGKKENDAFWQIREWEAKKAHKGDAEYTFSPYEHLRELIDNGKDLTGEIAYLQEHGKTASAINSDIKKYIRQQFDGGELNEQEAMKMLQKYHKVKDDRTGKYRNDTEDEAWFILDEWKAGIESEDDEEFSYEKYRKLYSAMDNDDDASAAWEEMSEHGVSDDTLKKAVSAHLQKQFRAGEISEDVAIDRLQSYRGMDEDEAYWQVDKWRSSDAAYKAGEDFNESNYRDLYAAIDGNKDPATAMKELTSHGYKESDVYTQAKKYLSEKLEKGEITEQAFKNKLSRYCKIVKADEVDDAVQSVKNSVRYKKLMESKPNLDATESQVNSWYDGTANTRNNGHESAKTAGMSIENYIKAKTILADVKDANGNRTGEDEYIAALTKITWLTPRQKDALYYERYKGTTKYSRKTW